MAIAPQLRLPLQGDTVDRWRIWETYSPYFQRFKVNEVTVPGITGGKKFTVVVNVDSVDKTIVPGVESTETEGGRPVEKQFPLLGIAQGITELSSIRDSHSWFYQQVDQRGGICPVLSAYAVARCIQAGGLF